MRQLGHMLGGAIAQAEVLRAARAQRALRHWPQVVGPGLASRSHPERYERGTVWVAVEGSAWAQELRMIKDVIIDRLEQHAGERGLFIDVRFGVRPLPERSLTRSRLSLPSPLLMISEGTCRSRK